MTSGDIPGLMAMAFHAVMDTVHERLAEQGFADVRPAHGFVFQLLSHTRGSTAVEIAAHLGVTKQGATQLLAELETRGYVQRMPHPTDRRARLVSLTERGWACVAAVVAEWRAIEEGWVELVGREGLEGVEAALRVIVGAAGGRAVLRPLW
ncbi:MarR family winged helix-turn-helix transcriptional regulator [Phytomonospora endophytica]|uniref:DNA-binding MarR family transcriptional regulator n=1 Tax=Phytomonospora endophytica TaxID=714109 RepID=A0A841FJM1_9ACTN|nr:MarR family winged helix-turn-helix transcriptional regulator [Phytomonospora endophytica]MBB6037511.1 DNA-binding MarR family transcriptional regulator [Phytomonospora endophytica]GIG70763.1 MarR family transcriptional regulator [Phytomonospora endophytica]